MARFKQFILTGINENTPTNDSFPVSLDDWCGDGSLGGNIGTNTNSRVYSLQIYGMPGTQFYLNDGIVPIELGPSGYYGLELGGQTEEGLINKIIFDQLNLNSLYSTALDNNDSLAYSIIPLVIDVKCI